MNYNGDALINNSNFINNSASWGGAVYTVGKHTSGITKLTVLNSVFDGNKATFGAAVYVENAAVEVDNSLFKFNKGIGTGSYGTSSTQGAAILVMEDTDGSYANVHASASIKNSNFTNNSANKGGAISFATVSDASTVDNCNFINNTASQYGGAIRTNMANNAVLKVSNSNFTNNTAPSGKSNESGKIRVLW